MTTTVVTAKGQVVIPSKIRHRLKIKTGTRFCVVEKGDKIIFQPLTEDYFERMSGVLDTKGRLTKAILEEREKEKRLEDKKWSR